jgi:hypothetical protein
VPTLSVLRSSPAVTHCRRTVIDAPLQNRASRGAGQDDVACTARTDRHLLSMNVAYVQ